MSALSAEALLTAWEVGSQRGAVDRAIALLWAAQGTHGDAIAALPLAERDRQLLALHGATFGDTLACVTECPECGTQQEFSLSAAVLQKSLACAPAESVELDGFQLQIRALNSRDLAEVCSCADIDTAAQLLRERAVTCESTVDVLRIDALPDTTLEKIDAHIEARERAAETRLALDCTACSSSWVEFLDIATFVWAECDAAVHRLLIDVADLARSFGWSEQEILNLSEERRSAYLALIRGA